MIHVIVTLWSSDQQYMKVFGFLPTITVIFLNSIHDTYYILEVSASLNKG